LEEANNLWIMAKKMEVSYEGEKEEVLTKVMQSVKER